MTMFRIDVKSLAIGAVLGILARKLWTKSNEVFFKSRYLKYYEQSECFFFTPKMLDCTTQCYLEECPGPTTFPCNNCSLQKILDQMKKAEKQLDICMYLLTSSDMSDTILMMLKRGVYVRIIADHHMTEDAFGAKMLALRQSYVPIKLVKTSSMMHNKFAVIDEKLVITGSANWTKQGFSGNYENMVVLAHPEIAKKYSQHFQLLWDMPN